MANDRKYSDADVRAILDRALNQGAPADGLSHDELLSIGEQVGVSRDALARAAKELHEESLDEEARQVLAMRRRRWLGYHAALFALVNALAFTVNFLTTPGEWWSLFSIVPWLFALVLHAGLNAAVPASEPAVARQRQRLAAKGRTGSRVRVAADSASHHAPLTAPPSADSSEVSASPPPVSNAERR